MEKQRKTEFRSATLLVLAAVAGCCMTSVAASQQASDRNTPGPDAATMPKPAPRMTESDSVERRDILPLAGNSLHASTPLMGQKDTLPSFTRELIRVQWRAAD